MAYQGGPAHWWHCERPAVLSQHAKTEVEPHQILLASTAYLENLSVQTQCYQGIPAVSRTTRVPAESDLRSGEVYRPVAPGQAPHWSRYDWVSE